jgi:hypothetical protein
LQYRARVHPDERLTVRAPGQLAARVLLKSRFSSKLIVHRFEAIAQTPEHLQ